MPYKDPVVARIKAAEANRRHLKKKRMERHAAKLARIASRVSPPPEDCTWAAGHFEGEGTVTMSKGGRLAICRPLCSLSSTDFEVIKFFDERWPGLIKEFGAREKSANSRPVRQWVLYSNEKVECFLRDIKPYVRTTRVREKIDLVLEDIQDRVLYQRDEALRERSRIRRARMKALNARGVNSVPGTNVTFGEATQDSMRIAYEQKSHTPLLEHIGGAS